MTRKVGAASVAGLAMTVLLAAQGDGRPPSPNGSSATQVGGRYTTAAGSTTPSYQGGKWIEITYGRPIKRGRDLWGSGADYGKNLLAGAPAWRAGANDATQLKTEAPLVINGKTIPPGDYSVLIDLKPNAWTLILSTQPFRASNDTADSATLPFNYTPAKDVVRAPMTLSTLPFSVDQLTWNFLDMSDAGGKLAIMWDKTAATTPFTVGK
jgi:hypothetical protein